MQLEAAAVAAAAEVVTLSRSDADFVARELASPGRSSRPKVWQRTQRAGQAMATIGMKHVQ